MPVNVSIILSSYNRPLALKQVLLAFNQQCYKNFEVIIADDGSDASMAEMLAAVKTELHYPLNYVWQEDKGFRAARSRNNALLKSRGEYIIFVDGDCIPGRHFIQDHLRLAEPGWLVRGSRIMLNQQLTREVELARIDILALGFMDLFRLFLQKKIKRISPLFKIPLGVLRKYRATEWRGVKTCNLAVWKKDLLRVNGFDERFEGWGHEDAELSVRLFHAGVRRKEGLYAIPVFHLWHKESTRSSEQRNAELLQASIDSDIIRTPHGLV